MNIPTTRAHAELEVPQVAEIAYRATHGLQSRARRNPGVYLSWRGTAQQGRSQIRQGVSVIFPVPGLYYVRAALASADPEIDAAGMVQNAAAPKVVWVNVTSTGGTVIPSLEALHAFQQTNTTRDPLRVYAAQPSAATGLSAEPALTPICDPNDPTCNPPPPPGPSSTQFSGTLQYYSVRAGQNVGLPRAKVAIFDTRGTGFNSVAETDADGNFTLDCPPSYEQGYLQMAASSTNLDVTVLVVNRPSMPQRDLGYWPDAANASVNECGAYTGVYAVGAPSQAETFDNMTQTVAKSQQVFQVTRRPIGVNFVDGPQDSTRANYNPTTDSITIHEGYATGSFGLFGAAHEYGHAVHEKALGRIIITVANASDPTCVNHSYTLVTNYQCAYREGFADYHAVALWGAALGDTLYPEFNNGVFAGAPVGTSYPPIGPSTEGAIASTLLHLGDGTGGRYVYNRYSGAYLSYSDNVAFGHATIAAAVRDCHIQRFGESTTVPADGIDYLVYCLEKNVVEVVPQRCDGTGADYYCYPLPATFLPDISNEERQFFTGLRPDSIPPAAEWFWGDAPSRPGYDTNVRAVWECNLFFCQ